jgi:oxygen-independent coproporphyrinogen-3 oxidase
MLRHLYVHIPFCHRICPYCSFYKHTPGSTDLEAFVDALLAELDTHLASIAIQPTTIYFGGGTPTFLSRIHLERLLAGLRERLDLSALREWTMEANPATYDLSKARLMRDLGVSRVSLGVQSWVPKELTLLGRDHAPDDAAEAFGLLREAGIGSVNIDLMFSLPGQSLEDWRQSLEQTLALKPDHISAYNLTYEEDTEFMARFQNGELDASEQRDADQFLLADELLSAAGFSHYEISNYAQVGHQSAHNEAYWAGENYLGLGPGAVSTVSRRRWKNLPNTPLYTEKALAHESLSTEPEELSAVDLTNEAIALQLRTRRGLLRKHLAHVSLETLESLRDEALLSDEGDRVCLTAQGRLIADAVAAELLA